MAELGSQQHMGSISTLVCASAQSLARPLCTYPVPAVHFGLANLLNISSVRSAVPSVGVGVFASGGH